MRRAAKAIVLAILVAATVIAAALSTTGGQSLAMRQAVDIFGNGDVAVGKLSGSLFGSGTLDEIRLSDADGPWLTIRGISYAWSPWDLLTGRLSVSHLRVDTVTLARLPPSGPPPEPKTGNGGFSLPLALRIDALDVQTIDLLAPIVGEAVRLRISGNADVNGAWQASHARLHVARLDGAGGALTAHAAYAPETRGLSLKIDGNEPEGGAVSRLLGLASRPALTVRVDGRGDLDAWRADLALAAAGTPFVAGALSLDRLDDGRHRIGGQIAGYIDRLLPSAAAELFAERTNITLSADVAGLSDGAPRSVDRGRLDVSGRALTLSIEGGADLSNGYVHGTITGQAKRPDGKPLTLTGGDTPPMTVHEINLRASLPDIKGARQFTATAAISGASFDQLSVGSVAVTAHARQPAPAGARATAFEAISLMATASGMTANGALADAVGTEAKATLSGAYDGERLTIASAEMDAAGVTANLSGTFDRESIDGTIRVGAGDLSRYAGLAGRALSGGVALNAKVTGNPRTQVLSATIEGESTRVATGIAAIDGLLAPTTRFAARIERTTDGSVRASDVALTNPMLSAALAGRLGPQDLALSGNVSLASLAAIDPGLGGTARLDLEIGGSGTGLTSALTITGDSVTLDGKAVTEPRISFSGQGPRSEHLGTLAISGRIAGERVNGTARVALSDTGASRIDGLELDVAGARLAGDLDLPAGALPSGRFKLDAQNLGRLGRAVGAPLKGRLSADVELARNVENGLIRLNVSGDNIAVGDVRVEGLRSSADISGYLATPNGSVNLKVSRIARGGDTLASIALGADVKAGAATFKSSGQLQGGAFAFAGKAQSANGRHDIDLQSFSYGGRNDVPRIALASASRLSVRDGGVSTRGLQLAIGSGSLMVAGSAGSQALDLSVTLKRLPAALAAIAAPSLGIAGTVDGNATIKGSPSQPNVVARIAATGMSVNETRNRQLPAIDVTTDVSTASNQAKVAVKATARGGLEFLLNGTVGLDSAARLALTGRGKVPLSLANVFLADRAARVGGTASLAADVSGQLSAPLVNGRIALKGATATDPASGLELSEIDADVGFTIDRVEVRTFVARSKKGGQVTATGNVLLPAAGDPTMNVGVRLSAFKFGNQDPVAGELDGHVTIAGPLTSLAATGDVLIKRMDVTVPNKLPQSVAALDIRHVNAPKRFETTDRRDAGDSDGDRRGAVVSLSVDVQAHDRIFVRGRGVDAQLGGLVKVRGTADKPMTDGQFSMTRGRLSIIGRQLDFTRGNIVFMGSVEPTLDMAATADVDGTTVTVTVSGSASNPKISFSSMPELPEDEVVSLLLFNKALASLSPTQLVTLAGEIDKIGGLSSGPGTLDKMKSALGIDVLDVTTDKSGGTQATAGSFIDDKTYVGVKQGMSLGNTRVVIDRKLTKHLKARGEVGTDGDSKLGLGVEWDY